MYSSEGERGREATLQAQGAEEGASGGGSAAPRWPAQAPPRGCSPCPALRGLPQPPGAARHYAARRDAPEVREWGRRAAPAAARPTWATGGGTPRWGGNAPSSSHMLGPGT